MPGIQIAGEAFVDVTVNSEFALGKNQFKRISFDARFKRLTPEELTRLTNARSIDERAQVLDLVREKLISTDGIKDSKGANRDVVAGSESDHEVEAEHERTLDDFMATMPLPFDAAAAYAKSLSKQKN